MTTTATPPVTALQRTTSAVHLTDRERDVLRLISRGLTNQEIADQLYLSLNSIKTYIRSAYRRIGVTRRSQAVIWGIAHSLGAPSDVVEPATLVPVDRPAPHRGAA